MGRNRSPDQKSTTLTTALRGPSLQDFAVQNPENAWMDLKKKTYSEVLKASLAFGNNKKFKSIKLKNNCVLSGKDGKCRLSTIPENLKILSLPLFEKNC